LSVGYGGNVGGWREAKARWGAKKAKGKTPEGAR